MAQVADCMETKNAEVGQHKLDQTLNTSPIHLLKIDFPIVSQEYQEHCKHYIGTISEKVLDPDGYLTIKTKVDHYLYTVNVSSDIGKPVLSDIVRFPQEILTPFTKNNNNSDKIDKSQDCSQNDFDVNNNFANLQIKSTCTLIRESKRKKNEKITNRNRKKLRTDDESGGICNCYDDESDECICDEYYDDSEEYTDYDQDEEQSNK
ncbi:hypothetical protein O3M35_001619 [Rhynocoris fuscipes]|uniref:Uncharacterized protein n=1 Tax=Rhynocoris fuscipes TaxID=488301 RepID=A0AAW1CN48_9HEMI